MTSQSIPTDRPLCKTCRYWHHPGGEPRQILIPGVEPTNELSPMIIDFHARKGQCRKNPPRSDRGFPTAFADQWCGQHTA